MSIRFSSEKNYLYYGIKTVDIIVCLDKVLPKIILLCHVGQCWPKCGEKKTFAAKLDQDTQ